ncbi:uncharacterized protein LOC122320576 [Drosophila ficusphila]|uniref:uncharacterized protein LOC122320576 n=1 Tax=Drosophila ficusphila TaxID=30025 RepID=UPI001C8A5BB9|nr:uncharacterized protein LOC122320576 [Drosophila ficusphila]
MASYSDIDFISTGSTFVRGDCYILNTFELTFKILSQLIWKASQQIPKPIVESEATTSNHKPFFDFVELKANEKTTTRRTDAIIVKRQYLERGVVSQDTDPLLWIQMNETDLQLIKTVVLKSTSVESERMFSKAGQIVSDRRTRLKEKNINILLFLNSSQLISTSTSKKL